MIRFLDLPGQYRSLKPEIDAAMRSVAEKAAFIGGETVVNFEADFARYQQADFCVGVGNGTDALEIAIEALDIPAGGEIIVPANSFVASSEAVTRTGHRVVFADVDPHSYLLDPADVARRITAATAAIMPVHLYGQPAPMEELAALAAEHGLRVIEDCAQAHGAEIDGRRVGNFGDVATFSFYPGKNLGAFGDGGAILCNDEATARRCRMIANHGRIEKYNHEFEGRNSRLDALQAAVLAVKLGRLDAWIAQRQQVATAYDRALADIDGIATPATAAGLRHVHHLYVIRCTRRDELRAHLSDNDIQTGIHYPIALPRLTAYANHPQHDEAFTATEICPELLSLPIGEHLDEDDARLVADRVRKFMSA